MTFFDITDRVKPTLALSVGTFCGSRAFEVAGKGQKALLVLDEVCDLIPASGRSFSRE